MGGDTMLAALHGGLAVHPRYTPGTARSDAYGLFLARSSAMAWLTEAEPGTPGGLWGMNDAGQDAGTGSAHAMTRRLWFQVEPTAAADRPPPVQPFLSCAGQVAARIGVLDLKALQILVPMPDRSVPDDTAVSALAPLLQDAGWFADTGSGRRVRVTLDSGQVPGVVQAAPGMLAWMRSWKQQVFSCGRGLARGGADAAEGLVPGIADHLWNGPGHHRVSIDGTVAEWSLDALGWLVAFLVEAGAQHGIRTPLVITVRAL